MKQTNLSVFIPHLGCPNNCSFCNQRFISGQSAQPTVQELHDTLDGQLSHLRDSDTCAEIAFFGGSFTAIDREYMTALLKTAREYTLKYPQQYCGIRCSTRPDCIDGEVLDVLREYGMTAIELGAQSMDDKVLSANDRGHTAEDVRRAAKLIKAYGFTLGLQMMTGLYTDTAEGAIATAREFITLGADCVRIYPTVILRGTWLDTLMNEGKYRTLTFDETVDLCAELLQMFEAAGIPVIRLGLHASRDVEREMTGGVYHPALREICESRIVFGKMLAEMQKTNAKRFVIYTDKRNISRINGQKRCNKERLSEMGYNYRIKEESGTDLRVSPLD